MVRNGPVPKNEDPLEDELAENDIAEPEAEIDTPAAEDEADLSLDFEPDENDLRDLLDHIRRAFPHQLLLLGNLYDPTDGTGLVQSSQRRGAKPMHTAMEAAQKL